MTTPRIRDDDMGTITAEVDGREIRGWSYPENDRADRRQKMLQAHEFAEGWYQAKKAAADPDMLEALEAAQAMHQRYCDRVAAADGWARSLKSQIDAAIAKAKGGDA